MRNRIIAVTVMVAVVMCALAGIADARPARATSPGGAQTLTNRLTDKFEPYVPTAEEKAACDAWRQDMLDKEAQKKTGVLGPFGGSGMGGKS